MIDYRQVLLADPCAYCSRPANSLEHVHPRSRGGNEDGNLVGACGTCNRSKGAMSLLFFLLRRRLNADMADAKEQVRRIADRDPRNPRLRSARP